MSGNGEWPGLAPGTAMVTVPPLPLLPPSSSGSVGRMPPSPLPGLVLPGEGCGFVGQVIGAPTASPTVPISPPTVSVTVDTVSVTVESRPPTKPPIRPPSLCCFGVAVRFRAGGWLSCCSLVAGLPALRCEGSSAGFGAGASGCRRWAACWGSSRVRPERAAARARWRADPAGRASPTPCRTGPCRNFRSRSRRPRRARPAVRRVARPRRRSRR